VLTEHCDGAKFCEPLFGHYLLPNGRLAHFYKHVCSCSYPTLQCWLVDPDGLGRQNSPQLPLAFLSAEWEFLIKQVSAKCRERIDPVHTW
jgi:hypothetical protein